MPSLSFKRIASSRTKRVLDDVRLLGNCSNINTYAYSEEDMNKIFAAIEKEVKRVKSLFNQPITEFSLDQSAESLTRRSDNSLV
jgi:hypothetical protein